MPWLALDFNHRDIKNKLSKGFSVNGIPKLVWINVKTGEVNENGRETITYGSDYYPWTKELLEKAKKEKVEKDKLK